MGVIEAQTRGEIAALDAEMEAQRAAMKANAEDGASAAVVAIKDEFSDLEIHVPIIFDIPRVPGFPMEQPEPVPGASTGAKVLPFGIQHLAGGGWARRGTDTVPAMLTPGELVLNAAQQKNVAAAMRGNDGPRTIIVPVSLDGREIARVVVPMLPEELRRRGVA